MIKKLFIGISIATSLLASVALAQDNLTISEQPQDSSAMYTAFLWHKLAGVAPAFDKMAEQSAAYRKAAPEKKPQVLQQRAQELASFNELVDPAQPLIVTYQTKISPYEPRFKRIRALDIEKDTFFSYVYSGTHYAIVPRDIMNFYELRMESATAKEIIQSLESPRTMNMVFTLIPRMADKKPLTIDGKNHYLLMADIEKMEIWTQDGKMLVWQKKQLQENSAPQEQNLMQLYQ